MNKPKVACVIPTRNRLSCLKECLKAVEYQSFGPKHIIVVENAGTDETADWLRIQAARTSCIIPLFMSQNTGGAGGYHYGIKTAVQGGAEWIWTLDDDALPAEDALERLLEEAFACKEHPCNVGFVASRVNWTDGSLHAMNITAGKARSQQGGCTISYASFVSTLFSSRAVLAVGLPIKEFFLYFDDVEFTRRITRAGFKGLYCDKSLVVHRTRTNSGLTITSLIEMSEQIEKAEMAIRNLFAVNQNRPFGLLVSLLRMAKFKALLSLKGASQEISKRLMRAARDGLSLDYSSWIVYPEAKTAQE